MDNELLTDIVRELNRLRQAVEGEERTETLRPLYARVRRSTNQTIADATQTEISFSHERWDTGANSTYPNGFWAIANPTRLTAVVSGNYIITGHVVFAANATGCRSINIRLTSGAVASIIAEHGHPAVATAARGTAMSIATAFYMQVGDYVELRVHQTSGGNLDVQTAAAPNMHTPEFTIARVA